MMNKKLIALLVAVATVSAMSADYGDCYEGRDGYEHCKSVGRGTVQESANVAEKTGRFVGGLFGADTDKSRSNERKSRRERREERREEEDNDRN